MKKRWILKMKETGLVGIVGYETLIENMRISLSIIKFVKVNGLIGVIIQKKKRQKMFYDELCLQKPIWAILGKFLFFFKNFSIRNFLQQELKKFDEKGFKRIFFYKFSLMVLELFFKALVIEKIFYKGLS